MPKKTAVEQSKNRRVWHLVALAGIAILAYFLFSLSSLVANKSSLDERYNAINSEVTALKQQTSELERQVAQLQTDDALEALAREELGWTKEGETAVVVKAPTPTPAAKTTTSTTLKVSNTPNWERWWQVFFGE